MKAEIVHNRKGEPRLLVTFETDEERKLFEGGPHLAPAVEGGEVTDEVDIDGEPVERLAYFSYTFEPLLDVRIEARAKGVPGPDVDEHPEGYDGECYCRLCLSYAD